MGLLERRSAQGRQPVGGSPARVGELEGTKSVCLFFVVITVYRHVLQQSQTVIIIESVFFNDNYYYSCFSFFSFHSFTFHMARTTE